MVAWMGRKFICTTRQRLLTNLQTDLGPLPHADSMNYKLLKLHLQHIYIFIFNVRKNSTDLLSHANLHFMSKIRYIN